MDSEVRKKKKKKVRQRMKGDDENKIPCPEETHEDEERGNENETELRLFFVSLVFVVLEMALSGSEAKEDRKRKRKIMSGQGGDSMDPRYMDSESFRKSTEIITAQLFSLIVAIDLIWETSIEELWTVVSKIKISKPQAVYLYEITRNSKLNHSDDAAKNNGKP
ncbi:hypothetical protein Scep_010046 [Stephania cephalantha]|uniref:Uncharacterized protein n=1 Tax=Stephania cephalantha TaxID=152367 RepID=A0AAP0PGQ2_9MAGN